MVLSHYMLSPGGKKRCTCWATGPFNYALWDYRAREEGTLCARPVTCNCFELFSCRVAFVCLQACAVHHPRVRPAGCLHTSLMSSFIFCWWLDLIWFRWLHQSQGRHRREGRTHRPHAYSSVHGLNQSTGAHDPKNIFHPKCSHTQRHALLSLKKHLWGCGAFPNSWKSISMMGGGRSEGYVFKWLLNPQPTTCLTVVFIHFQLGVHIEVGCCFGSIFVDISFRQLNISSMLRHARLSVHYKRMTLALPNLLMLIYPIILSFVTSFVKQIFSYLRSISIIYGPVTAVSLQQVEKTRNPMQEPCNASSFVQVTITCFCWQWVRDILTQLNSIFLSCILWSCCTALHYLVCVFIIFPYNRTLVLYCNTLWPQNRLQSKINTSPTQTEK